MQVILCNDYEEMSQKAARIVASQIIIKPESVMGFATGSTPERMYEILSQMNKSGEVDFEKVCSYNLDEYYPLCNDDCQSYHYFMKTKLFDKINIKPENTHLLDGMASDPKKECADYEAQIKKSGGIDLQILGIGENGHIGFNEPDVKLNSKTHLTQLTESTINANSRFFSKREDVPTKALTMGIATILNSRKIILMASGAAKHKVVAALMSEKIDTDIPASLLNIHPDVVLLCDKAAYYSERIGIDLGGTETKFGVLDSNNKLVYQTSVPTVKESENALADSITEVCREIMSKYNITGIGVGTPGFIRDGLVSAVNLPFDQTDLSGILTTKLGLNVKVSNDANCAALGEALCGVGEAASNIVMITLGTGVGGGIIVNNRIYTGRGSAGEVGHFCVNENGRKCACGKMGCWETYASVTAFVRIAEEMAMDNENSILFKLYKENGGKLSGRIIEKAVREDCEIAKQALDVYGRNIAVGITSLESIFDPDMFVLSGGITNMGDLLLDAVKKHLSDDIHVEISVLKNDAGIIGAAMLQ